MRWPAFDIGWDWISNGLYHQQVYVLLNSV